MTESDEVKPDRAEPAAVGAPRDSRARRGKPAAQIIEERMEVGIGQKRKARVPLPVAVLDAGERLEVGPVGVRVRRRRPQGGFPHRRGPVVQAPQPFPASGRERRGPVGPAPCYRKAVSIRRLTPGERARPADDPPDGVGQLGTIGQAVEDDRPAEGDQRFQKITQVFGPGGEERPPFPKAPHPGDLAVGEGADMPLHQGAPRAQPIPVEKADDAEGNIAMKGGERRHVPFMAGERTARGVGESVPLPLQRREVFDRPDDSQAC